MLEANKIDRTLKAFILNSMGLWNTILEANSRLTTQVSIKSGIYQGDALPHLLCCIGLNPLHLSHMDDIKMFAKTERDINSLFHIIRD